MKSILNGCVDIWLDEIVPCLKDLETGSIEETFVFKIESRSVLKKYSGVGGHLFAIAADISLKWGFDGFVYGFALNKELLNHYIEILGCSFVGILHPYHFLIEPSAAQKLLENYTYEWN